MNEDNAVKLYTRIERDSYSQNLFARANARYILLGVNEERVNFPGTLESNLDFGSDTLAFSYLSIGCVLAESNIFNEITKDSLEKGAAFIEYNHLPVTNRNDSSNYYLLVGALAYYASFQYSKAFILIKEADAYETDLSILISAFLRKNFNQVNAILNKILLEIDEYLLINEDNFLEKVHHPHIVIFAKAITNLMHYLYTGRQTRIDLCVEILNDLMELLSIDKEPSMWWIARLFKIIANGFKQSSLWTNIPPLLPEDASSIGKDFINNMIFGKKPIVELFLAQRSAIPLISKNEGAVISLPTSSGKTQIAMLAILKSLTEYENSKVLYIAPYRSLAYEVESTLRESFEILGFEISQLYGNGQFGKMDKLIIEDSDILIATPEKAKVILRANQELNSQIKLVIIDEGHLLDEKKRNVKNELFIEELKFIIKNKQGKIFLLSAVLPNSSDIANWVTDNEELTVTEHDRLARQRLGILEFRNNTVSLEWMGDEKSFNRNFIRPIPPTGRKKIIQPSEKSVGVAMAALRLSEQGKSVLFFTSRAISVNKYANAILQSMDILYHSRQPHVWTDMETWEELKLLCSEYDCKENNSLIEFSKYGILCHYGGLNKDIRNALERLMKTGNPRIIVATMTLGQGVNLGVSTVILADTDFYDQEKKKWVPITSNEVWNVIGRAGRAFQDIEGKILFVIQNKHDREIAMQYINNPPKNVTSGLLLQIKRIKKVAEQCGLEFEKLLEIIAENDFSFFEKYTYKGTGVNVASDFHEVFDWIDDTLLSLEILAEDRKQNLDDIFRSTLAYIQASKFENVSPDNVIEFLFARVKGLDKMIPTQVSKNLLVSSSLPLASAIFLEEKFDVIIEIGVDFLQGNQSLEERLSTLQKIEELVAQFPSLTFKPKIDPSGAPIYSQELITEARELWISGNSLSGSSNIKKIIKLSNDYFSYTLSWVLGAISNKCRLLELNDLADFYEELALSCELGLPDTISAKTYLTGIRSRISIKDIAASEYFFWNADSKMSIPELKGIILDGVNELLEEVTTDIARKWLLFAQADHLKRTRLPKEEMRPFSLPGHPNLKTKRLYVKSINQIDFYLASPDYSESFTIEVSKKWPFNHFANKMNCFFVMVDGYWRLKTLV